MGTRSRIGVQLPDGKVKSVYCHWDGYPDGVGLDLIKANLNTFKQVKEFIDKGSRSTVHDSYHEMRGEDIVTRIDESIEEYGKSDLEQYGYIFTKDNTWNLISDGIPRSLTDYLDL